MFNLVWFRNDLRIHDNPSLLEAEKQAIPTVCVYILPEIHNDYYDLGFPSIGKFRKRFLMESLIDLNERLVEKGSSLLLLKGKSTELFKKMSESGCVKHLYFQAEMAWNERKEEQEITQICKQNGLKVFRHFNSVLYDVQSLPFQLKETPDVFTQFRKKVEKQCTVEIDLPEPRRLNRNLKVEFENSIEEFSKIFDSENRATIEELQREVNEMGEIDERTAFPFSGGERSGKQRIQDYLFGTDSLSRYKETRNCFIGTDYSSKLSAYLAIGCVSSRYLMREVKRYEKERFKNDSTYWIFVELLWREYWRYIFFKHERAYFYQNGISSENKIWVKDKTLFEKWRIGESGFPLVDANMRELLETGWMSNRGRQIVASFLAKNLEIDWRWGAAWFESQLIDYDVYSNWGNWAYVAGVGNDGRDRYFNLMIQAEKYDSNGEFMKLWCPELSKIAGKTLGVIHQLSDSERLMLDLNEGLYPEPIINLAMSYENLNSKKSGKK